MKRKHNADIRILLACLMTLCFLLLPLSGMQAQAAAFPVFDPEKDIDYTDGEGAEVELTHVKDDPIVSYEIDDTRLTRNATFYMSMQARFDNSHSWAIRLRNVTCRVGDETVTGDMEFHLFKNNGTMLVGDKGIDNWPGFTDINDNEWHEITVRSAVDSFELWVDGVRGRGLYYLPEVSDMVSNYTCPAVILGGWNSGTVKNIRIWNDGTEENPVMPADQVAQSIEMLPDAVSLSPSDRGRVAAAASQYAALSDSEKSFVPNYDKLQQLVRVSGSGEAYEIRVSGSEEGDFEELFPDGVLSQRRGQPAVRYYFETEASRNSTYYIQCVVNMQEDSNCFDIYLRNQKHVVAGKKVLGPVSIRLFKNSAAVLDSRQNEVSGWINYGTNLFEGSHIITVESTPGSCTVWIDETKYEVPEYLANVSGVECIQAQSGIAMTGEVTGTVSDIRVWNDRNSGAGGQNRYGAGDAARIAIFRLPQLTELAPEHEEALKEARALCQELEEKELKYVTNLEKLERSERAIAFLKEAGDHAYGFLRDELPQVQEDYLNLISTGTLDIPPEHNSRVSYNAQTHELNFTDPMEYINTPFTGIQGISAEDTWLLRFHYLPHEYYYESEGAGWMGLRITFAGYRADSGGGPRNRHQFVFFVNQTGMVTMVNNNGMPVTYQPGFTPEMEQQYQVTMLCEQGRMKIWVNGEPLAYYDDLAKYPFALEFESSRCRCDLTDIELYNLSSPTELKSQEKKAGGFQFMDDVLYYKEGITATDRLEQKKSTWQQRAVLTASVGLLAVVVWIFCIFYPKKGAGKKRKNPGEGNPVPKKYGKGGSKG